MRNQYGDELEEIEGVMDTERLQENALAEEITQEAAIMPEPEETEMPTTPVPALIPQIQSDDLNRAQEQRDKLQQFGMLMKAFQGFSNIPRQMMGSNAKADTSIQDQVIEMANQPITDVTNKRNIAAADQKLSATNIDLQNKMLDNDAASDQSRSYQELMLQMMPSFDQERLKSMSARQIEAVMAPISRWQQFKDMGVIRKEQLQSLNEARKAGQEDKDLDRELKRQALQARKEEKDKQTTALKEAQAKANKAYEVGILAEKQYTDAIANPKKYDPTSTPAAIGNALLNNRVTRGYIADERRQAEASGDAWVDSFLRLDSGAAIPIDERTNYKPLYFAQSGDDPKTVANKAALRQAVMKAAKTASGTDKVVTLSQAKALENSILGKMEEASSFPRKVRKGTQSATVSNEKQLKEAQDEGYQ